MRRISAGVASNHNDAVFSNWFSFVRSLRRAAGIEYVHIRRRPQRVSAGAFGVLHHWLREHDLTVVELKSPCPAEPAAAERQQPTFSYAPSQIALRIGA